MTSLRNSVRLQVYSRQPKASELPVNEQGKPLKVSQYYGENVFNYVNAKSLTNDDKQETAEVIAGKKVITKELGTKIATAVLEWAISKGVTHFTHLFQPLTGSTAEKHDAFLSFDDERPIEKLSASQLMQGEPDASSFPHGGSRATFEARGYTTWDLTSPIFIKESTNGKTLVIPTAFISYTGDALDIKTPLLRSDSVISEVLKKFCHITGLKDVEKVNTTCGAEQEYFLIDKAFYFARPDLVMSGRTLIGSLTTRNQQLEDHYFGMIEERVLAFMQEVELELYKIGIPAKTRHNEVAPGQFEMAPIFKDSNTSADNNQMVLTVLRTVALKHDFVCLVHEKPFAGVNGSGKHLNWSMSTDTGLNILEPGSNPHENHRFLAAVTTVLDAVYRHADIIRMGIATHGNDHRLGANEAPPSIMSVFLGDTLTKIFESMIGEGEYVPGAKTTMDIGVSQLVDLKKDNTDRNRTSPFAFTGNKFEFRACGSSAAIGFPLSLLNAAVADAFEKTNAFLEKEISAGASIDEALTKLTVQNYKDSQKVVFNGDGYSEEWVAEAEKRGLGNHRTLPEAIAAFKDETKTMFLTKTGVYKPSEIQTRYNILLERYVKCREIEFKTLRSMILKQVLPVAIESKSLLSKAVLKQKEVGVESTVELELLKNLSNHTKDLYTQTNMLASSLEEFSKLDEEALALKIAKELMPLSEKVAEIANNIEDIVPEQMWPLPKYYDMLFIR